MVGLLLPEAMCDYFYCQAGDRDRIGFTVFMDGGRTLFDSVKPHPDWSLLTEPSVYTMRPCGYCFLE